MGREYIKLTLLLCVTILLSMTVNTVIEIPARAESKLTSVMKLRPRRLLPSCVIQNEPECVPVAVMDTAPPEYNIEKFTNPSGGGDPTNASSLQYTDNALSLSAGLTKSKGVHQGPSGKETWYNLPMGGVIKIMRGQGFSEEEYPYWIRDDGCKMFGNYIMIAANLELRPRGTIVETSLGPGIVCDTGSFCQKDMTAIDLCVNW